MKDFLQFQDTVRPKVVFFDAMGTLFGVAGSVGLQYATIAQRHGVIANATDLNQSFYEAFKRSGPPAFPGAVAIDITKLEYEWWKEITRASFQGAQMFADFDAFFADLFVYFASGEPWVIYPEIIQTLDFLHESEIPIGIISNFDSRLYSVLRSLSLDHYFQSVTISTEVGAAKPNGKIFRVALAKHNCTAGEAWHVGDSLKEDYEAATAMGLRGILVDRNTSER